MTTKCTASFHPPSGMNEPKDFCYLNIDLEWTARYQESLGMMDSAIKTKRLMFTSEEMINLGILQ